MLFYIRIERDRGNVDSRSFQAYPDKMLYFQGFAGFRRVCRKFLNFPESIESAGQNGFFGFVDGSSQIVVRLQRAYPDFHNTYAKGKITLICCMETDFDVMTKLSQILLHNTIKSVTVVKTDKPCCKDLSMAVMQAVKSSKLPVPVQMSSIFIDAEDVSEEAE
mgnify:CR=1 FL=1